MSLTNRDRVDRTREIRDHLLNYQDRRGPGNTPTGAIKELRKAVEQLTILVALETEGGTHARADQGAAARAASP